ncbi:unnamed protein product [Phytophthora fragariaefolia]|uniref:Unnamed protein product n=1 Tax=Phytophthora fragariaefolia TaxID=1490495 RepID=A0A9W6YAV1_9STRA|nr:unnamed protein product [Phytophthora fragariaefolia]
MCAVASSAAIAPTATRVGSTKPSASGKKPFTAATATSTAAPESIASALDSDLLDDEIQEEEIANVLSELNGSANAVKRRVSYTTKQDCLVLQELRGDGCLFDRKGESKPERWQWSSSMEREADEANEGDAGASSGEDGMLSEEDGGATGEGDRADDDDALASSEGNSEVSSSSVSSYEITDEEIPPDIDAAVVEHIDIVTGVWCCEHECLSTSAEAVIKFIAGVLDDLSNGLQRQQRHNQPVGKYAAFEIVGIKTDLVLLTAIESKFKKGDMLFLHMETLKLLRLLSAKSMRLQYKSDGEAATPDALVTTIDFAQNINLPHNANTPSLWYFLSLISVPVFGIHSHPDKLQWNLIYSERKAKKGRTEVISILDTYASMRKIYSSSPGNKSWHVYADNCGGQVKKSYVLQFLLFLVHPKSLKRATLSFLVKGHKEPL